MTFLIDWALKATLVLVAAFLVTGTFRRAPAAMRHFVWTIALSGIVLLPLAGTVVPRWEAPMFPVLSPAVPPAVTLAPERSERLPLVRDVPAGQPVLVSGAGNAAPAPAPHGLAAQQEPATAAAPAAAWRPSPVELLAAAWMLGALLVLGCVAAGLIRIRQLSRRARPFADQRLAMLLEETRRRLGVTRPVTLVAAGPTAMPVTWGVFHPVIALPASAVDWTSARLRAVLLHEMAHISRGDFATLLLARVACALHWYNPAAWLASRQLRVEGEHACDDVVLASGSRPSDYADHLLQIARAFRGSGVSAVASIAMARPSQLTGRLQAVLDASRTRAGLTARHAGAVVVLAGVWIALVAGAAAGTTPAPPEEPRAEPETAMSVSNGPGPSMPVRAVVPDRPAAIEDAAASLPVIIRTAQGSQCEWTRRGTRHNSSSTSVDDDRATITIIADDCRLSVEYRGRIVYAPDDSDILEIGRGGYFLIEERMGNERREAEIRPAGGGLERKWFVNRQERAWDAEAQAFLARVLPALFRRTGINAEARARRILERHGVQGLLQEIDSIPSDHAARRYYAVLLEREELTPDVVRSVMASASRRISSDHEMGRLLRTIAERQPMDESVRLAYVAAAGSIGSDHEHRRVLSAILDRPNISRELAAAMLRAAQAIDSDHELGLLLKRVLERHPLDDALTPAFFEAFANIDSDFEQARLLMQLLERGAPSQMILDQALEHAQQIGSSHERGRVLLRVASTYPLDGPLPAAYVRAAGGIGSDYEQSRVLRALLQRDNLQAETLQSVIELAENIDSDHELGRVLRDVLGRQQLHARHRPAFLRATASIGSDHAESQVLTAVIDAGYTDVEWVNGVLEGAMDIDSDHTTGQLLIHIAQKNLVTDATRDAFMRVLDTIGSESTRGRVLNALHPRGRPAE